MLAGVGFAAAHDCNPYKISRQPKRRPSPEAYGLTDVEAIYWIEKKGEKSVLEVAIYVSGKKAGNPAGYLVTALNRYFPSDVVFRRV